MIDVRESIEQIISKYEKSSESLIPVLQDMQEIFHYLPEEGLKKVSKELKVPLQQVFSVATFYNAFSLTPKGKYIIQVCMGTACHLKGAQEILNELCIKLNVEEKEVTKDGLFSIETVRCLGCCSLAPVININGKTFGNLKPEKVGEIIDEYRKK